MRHINRFKIVYVQMVIALASAIAGELTGMKDLTGEQLRNLTWVVWAICVANILVNTGNVIVASFQKPPEPKEVPASPTPAPHTV